MEVQRSLGSAETMTFDIRPPLIIYKCCPLSDPQLNMIHLLAWCSEHGVRADVQRLQMRSDSINAGIKGHLFEWLNPRWNHTLAAGKNPSFSVFLFCFRGRWEKECFFVCDERWTCADHKENETSLCGHTHTHTQKGWVNKKNTHTLPYLFPTSVFHALNLTSKRRGAESRRVAWVGSFYFLCW